MNKSKKDTYQSKGKNKQYKKTKVQDKCRGAN